MSQSIMGISQSGLSAGQATIPSEVLTCNLWKYVSKHCKWSSRQKVINTVCQAIFTSKLSFCVNILVYDDVNFKTMLKNW